MSNSEHALLAAADGVAEYAYAPYSGYRVGAVARARDGRLFPGANVESASYPLGICAERAALAGAVAAGCRPGDLEQVAITAPPCGGCRQWLVEFRLERVVYRERDGAIVARSPSELLPGPFGL